MWPVDLCRLIEFKTNEAYGHDVQHWIIKVKSLFSICIVLVALYKNISIHYTIIEFVTNTLFFFIPKSRFSAYVTARRAACWSSIAGQREGVAVAGITLRVMITNE